MNRVELIGRLTRDPELTYSQGNNTPVARFSIAISRPKRNGEDQGADYPRIVVFGSMAENCNKYLSKGRQVGVSGRIQTGSYKNKDGDTVYTTDVIADAVEFLGGGEGGSKNSAPEKKAEPKNEPNLDDLPDAFEVNDEDDIPF